MKYVLSILVLVIAMTTAYGQNKKMIEKANEKVEELNQVLISVNPDLALTETQQQQVRDLHVQKLIDIKEINKSDLGEEEKQVKRKEIYKNVGKTIHNEILTKEQKRAKREAKKNEEQE